MSKQSNQRYTKEKEKRFLKKETENSSSSATSMVDKTGLMQEVNKEDSDTKRNGLPI